tara:strand:- start:805 stop:2031 length:1227 start_codon:yes stop_codon:yes gene_type:complete
MNGALNDVDGTVAVGYKSLTALTSGAGNTAVGFEAGKDTTTGSNNTLLGYQAGQNILGGSNNIAIGTASGETMTGVSSAVLIGKQAGQSINNADALGTVAIGHQALKSNTSGQKNTAIGYLTLSVNNDIGDANTAVGYEALKNFNPSSDGHGLNTAVGASAGEDVSTGTGNTLIGDKAGNTGSNDITTGTLNTVVGQLSGISASDGTNQTVIGRGATGQGDNSVTLGNADVTDVYMAQDSGATVHCAGVVVSEGINFPDNAATGHSSDVNTLDNYEEGTHEPTLTGSTTAGTIGLVSAGNTLGYIKIGRQVTINGLLTLSSVSGSPAGALKITLPFAIADLTDNAGRFAGTVVINGTTNDKANEQVAIGIEGESFVRIYRTSATDIAEDVAEELSGNETIYVGFTYFS